MIVVGIDPGVSGGLATLVSSGDVSAAKMPGTPAELARYMHAVVKYATRARLSDPSTTLVFILEQVSAGVWKRPGQAPRKQGATSAFTFGDNFGMVRGVIACAIEFAGHPSWIESHQVVPQVWQEAVGCRTRGDKNISKARAAELFPGAHITHWSADALLLAEYGRRLKGHDDGQEATRTETRRRKPRHDGSPRTAGVAGHGILA